MRNFKFSRIVRTESSECYYISNSHGYVGQVDIHLKRYINGTLVIEQHLPQDDIDFLIMTIDDDIISCMVQREDFILTVYEGKEIGFYSDNVTESPHDPAKRGDVQKISKAIEKVLGRQQLAKGQLNEFVVCHYFGNLGYEASKAPNKYDHLKIDIIAENATDIVYTQVKVGSINATEIKKLVNNVIAFEAEKEKVIAIIATSFPHDHELLRRNIEKECGINIWLINNQQVLNVLPEYKRSLGQE